MSLLKRRSPQNRQRIQGYTLMELMITVVIVGVLAAIAVPTFTGYLQRSRTTEATTFLAEIRQRQETYRSEFGMYCDVSGGAIGNYTPVALPGPGEINTWPTAASIPEWSQLGAAPAGPVRFQYSTISGIPGGAAPPGTSGLSGTDFWFVAQARGDLDHDGNPLIMETYSGSTRIWSNSASTGWE